MMKISNSIDNQRKKDDNVVALIKHFIKDNIKKNK